MMAKAGRPTTYSDQLSEEICSRIASGESLRAICNDPEMPSKSTVLLWVAQDREGFSDQYEAACMARAHHWADELLDIADDSTNDYIERQDKDGGTYEALNGENIQRARLRVDARKWLLSKMLPKFADKQQHEVSGPNGGAVKTESTWTIQPVRPRADDE